MVKLPNDERTVLVAIGESGSGKSNLLNLILNTPGEHNVFFAEGDGAEACTLESGEDSGCWRGDSSRQVTVFDTPGLGADDVEEDLHNLQQILNLIKDLSYINCILIVVKSGTSRFLSQHQKMFENLERVFGSGVWANVVLDLSWTCSSRDKKNFEKWVEKLREKFPEAKNQKLETVYINTPDREFDTLEELWQLISEMNKYTFCGQRVPQIITTESKPIESPDISINSYDSGGSLGSLSQSLQDLRASRQSWNDLRPSERSNSDRHNSGPERHHSGPERHHSGPSSRNEILSRHSASRELSSRDSVDRVISSRDSVDRIISSRHSHSREILSRSNDLLSRHSVSREFLSSPVSRTETPSVRNSMKMDNFDILGLPPILPSSRSPTYRTRRSSYQPPRTPLTPGRLPRSFMPSTTATEDYSTSKYNSHRYKRRSFNTTRDTSPLSSISLRNSRETSPSYSGSFRTVGIPTYLRTCSAYKQPFVKAMRESRLAVSYGQEDRVLLENTDAIPYPDEENLDSVFRIPPGLDLFYVPGDCWELPPTPGSLFDLKPQEYESIQPSLHEDEIFIKVGLFDEDELEGDACQDLEPVQLPETHKIKPKPFKEEKTVLEKPESLICKNPMNYVKKALLPKVKYHWDKGFRQATSGAWEKVPVVKMKIKYPEEDLEILPTFVNIEGGRWCETKRFRMEGHKAKCKLRASEGPEFSIRVVPLDKDMKQECQIPEFLLTIFPGPLPSSSQPTCRPGSQPAGKPEEGGGGKEGGEEVKWIKGEIRLSLPE